MTPEQIAEKEAKEAAMWAHVDDRQAEIEKRLTKKVFPILIPYNNTAGYILGFAMQPDLATQLRLMDKGQGSDEGFSLEWCSNAMESLILTSETDPLILDKDGDALYWKGAAFALTQFLRLAVPVLKKR